MGLYRSLLITICLLLGLTVLGDTQSGTRRPQEPRGLPVVPATPPAAPAERRVALVIGNGQYHYVSRLDNPTNDARLIAATLTALGFTLVGGQAQLDLDKTAFDRAVQEFGTVIQGAEVALFYYAGHGVQVGGANYLVPTSANPTREAEMDFQLLNVDLVLRQMGFARTRLNLLILDACRNNPFAGRGLRAAGGGLAQMQAPEGTLISYATQPGNVAQDGTDGHSPYTAALANAFRKPGLDVFAVFNETGLDVKQRTGGTQQPWVSNSPITGQFYFTGVPDQQPTGGKDDAVEIAFWNSVKDDKTPDAFQTYLQQYPKGKFASLARLKIKELTAPPKPLPEARTVTQQKTEPTPPPAPPAADVQQQVQAARRRLEEERRLQEEQQQLQAEQERLRQEREKLRGGGSPQGTPVARLEPQLSQPGKQSGQLSTLTRSREEEARKRREGLILDDSQLDISIYYTESVTSAVFAAHLRKGWGFSVEVDGNQDRKWGYGAFNPQSELQPTDDFAFGQASDGTLCTHYIYAAISDHPDWRGVTSTCGKFPSLATVDTTSSDRQGFVFITYNIPKAELFKNRSSAHILLSIWDGKEEHSYYTLTNPLVLKRSVPPPSNVIPPVPIVDQAADAQSALEKGAKYEQVGEYRQAVELYRKAAEQGYAHAQNKLGHMYYHGQGVQQDHKEALKWNLKAAEQGLADGQNNVGFIYANSQALRDYKEAVKWYRKAAEQGYATAQFNLGTMYENGRGVEPDNKEAVKWYRKAAEQGHENAKQTLKRLQ